MSQRARSDSKFHFLSSILWLPTFLYFGSRSLCSSEISPQTLQMVAMPTAGAEMGHSCQLRSVSRSVGASEAAASLLGAPGQGFEDLLGNVADSGGLAGSAQKTQGFLLGFTQLADPTRSELRERL